MPARVPSAAPPRRASRLAVVLIAVTALACIGVLVFRTQIQSRYWAARVIAPRHATDQPAYLTRLCNAGDNGRWGTQTLLAHADPAVRQQGVIVLHHVRSAWSRGRLTELLADPDAGVAELAALGLAIHGDERVIPTLRNLFLHGGTDAARAACIALGRLATPSAVAVLNELIDPQRDAHRATALVDAFDDLDAPAAVPGLLRLLDDDRPCPRPARRELLSADLLRNLAGAAEPLPLPLSGHADAGESGATISERAAETLGRITGIQTPWSTTMPAEARAAARAAWQAWYGSRGAAPSP